MPTLPLVRVPLLEPEVSDTKTARSRQSIWAIAAPISRRQYWLFAVTGLLTPLVAWALLTATDWVDPIFLPGPLQVLQRF